MEDIPTQLWLTAGSVAAWVIVVVAMYVAGSKGGRNPDAGFLETLFPGLWVLRQIVAPDRMTLLEEVLAAVYWILTLILLVVAPIPLLWRGVLLIIAVSVCCGKFYLTESCTLVRCSHS